MGPLQQATAPHQLQGCQSRLARRIVSAPDIPDIPGVPGVGVQGDHDEISILENDNMEPQKLVVCVVDGISFFVGDFFRVFFCHEHFQECICCWISDEKFPNKSTNTIRMD